MKREFKKGDRVKVRRGGRADFKGTVEAVTGETSIQVIEDGCYSVHADAPFHPCQLVLLKPKKKPERRRAVVSFNQYGGVAGAAVDRDGPGIGAFYSDNDEFNMVELRPGEVIVSYEDLERAVSAYWNGCQPRNFTMSLSFIAKYLGLSPESKGEK